jgi:hypothetical protein
MNTATERLEAWIAWWEARHLNENVPKMDISIARRLAKLAWHDAWEMGYRQCEADAQARREAQG